MDLRVVVFFALHALTGRLCDFGDFRDPSLLVLVFRDPRFIYFVWFFYTMFFIYFAWVWIKCFLV